MGFTDKETVQRAELFVRNLDLDPAYRTVVKAAQQAASEAQKQEDKGNNGIYCGAAIQLRDGTIVTGSNSPLMHAASSLILNVCQAPGRVTGQDQAASSQHHAFHQSF